MTPDTTIADRCDNWGLAIRYRIIEFQTASKEGEYRSPQRAHWQTAGAPSQSLQIDARDAQAIESAVCTIPIYPHALLRAWHVYRVSEPVCLRLAAKAANEPRGRASGFESALAMAYALLTAALELPAVVRKDRARDRIRILLTAELA